MKRLDWDEYFLKIAKVASERSTCLRRQTGSVLVTRDNKVVSLGYNGAPSNLPHCEDLGGCLRAQLKVPSGERLEICRAVHAEQNAILIAAMNGSKTKQTKLYCTNLPCTNCAKEIIQAGIEQVVYVDTYGDEKSNPETRKLFQQAGVHLRKLHGRGE